VGSDDRHTLRAYADRRLHCLNHNRGDGDDENSWSGCECPQCVKASEILRLIYPVASHGNNDGFTVTLTVRQIVAKGLWEPFCNLRGIDIYARAEGTCSEDELFSFSESEARKIGIL
jgi:hypothetical protein